VGISFLVRRFYVAFLMILVLACSTIGVAEDDKQPASVILPFSVHVTHLLGFEGIKNNVHGTLAVEDDFLVLYTGGLRAAQVKLASVRSVSLGGESKEIGGLPMTLGKAAAPYGGGRVISLFAHKKYDTLAVEYSDANGGVHGAIFQLQKGEGQVLRNELVAKGAHTGGIDAQNTAEAGNEGK
jgi:hypothetical protein